MSIASRAWLYVTRVLSAANIDEPCRVSSYEANIQRYRLYAFGMVKSNYINNDIPAVIRALCSLQWLRVGDTTKNGDHRIIFDLTFSQDVKTGE